MVDRTNVGSIGDSERYAVGLPRIPVFAFGIALSAFLALTYLLCALFLVLFPDLPLSHSFLGLFLPWFKPLAGVDLLVGAIEAFILGWYVALVFGPLYNCSVAWFGRS